MFGSHLIYLAKTHRTPTEARVQRPHIRAYHAGTLYTTSTGFPVRRRPRGRYEVGAIVLHSPQPVALSQRLRQKRSTSTTQSIDAAGCFSGPVLGPAASSIL